MGGQQSFFGGSRLIKQNLSFNGNVAAVIRVFVIHSLGIDPNYLQTKSPAKYTIDKDTYTRTIKMFH